MKSAAASSTDRVNYLKIKPLKYITVGRISKHKESDMKNVKMRCKMEFNYGLNTKTSTKSLRLI
jgi:hypothetical protein